MVVGSWKGWRRQFLRAASQQRRDFNEHPGISTSITQSHCSLWAILPCDSFCLFSSLLAYYCIWRGPRAKDYCSDLEPLSTVAVQCAGGTYFSEYAAFHTKLREGGNEPRALTVHMSHCMPLSELIHMKTFDWSMVLMLLLFLHSSAWLFSHPRRQICWGLSQLIRHTLYYQRLYMVIISAHYTLFIVNEQIEVLVSHDSSNLKAWDEIYHN